jgi:hypothetical protein
MPKKTFTIKYTAIVNGEEHPSEVKFEALTLPDAIDMLDKRMKANNTEYHIRETFQHSK